ncbi:PLP-dependent aminotransferase family protein [Limosilactobacillus sp. RRLNB_1_1]|uniref:PLP-dependent aminotransferase family protein n=1 Tax=Limosilactobacillus albertensis TaxID=2759752 RepID=A0A7W3TSQ5_9LACO|nr:PLP-dependent aminotransferase family protein [Limosilactobacillus albertensis]MBB1069931.1 PLP-dependent aminotransferase family protein [Limosilactobacillus albertensis]MCD7117168.1 PLP-dependent aminotransferase family protein [Limosilactobacillus albertensis]MCD7128772.1 PLP-dependent aminotransferase family protein [Limosilactobacillus albertensis]
MPINDFSHYQLTWYPDKSNLPRPIYKSLLNQLKTAIEQGKLTPGTKLPPQRELADYLDINFTTVTRTYKLSAQLGLTYGIHGKGTFVNSNGIDPLTASPLTRTIDLGFVASFEQTNYLLDNILNNTVKQGAAHLLTYDSPTGRPIDKEAFRNYMNWLGVNLMSSQQILITAGGENSLTLLLMTLFSSGDKIAVDEFTYANLIATAQLNNLQLIAIKNDHGGMNVEALKQACQTNNLSGLYLMPEYSNPTGKVLSNARRKEIAAIAKKHKLKVIEDDYLSFLSKVNPEQPLKLMEIIPDQTCYVCSMSKVLASGLRIGYLVFPQQFSQQIKNGFFNTTVKTSTLNAAIASTAINEHVVQQIVQNKINLAKQVNLLFNQYFPFAPTNQLTDYAFFRRLPLKNIKDGPKIEPALAKINIRCFSSERFQINAASNEHFLRVSLSASKSMEELETGLKSLQQFLQHNNLI